MNRRWIFTVFAGCCLTVLVLECNQPQKPDTRAADEAAIQQADMAFLKSVQAKQTDEVVGYYSDDAVVMPPNGPMASNKDDIRKSWGDMISIPGFELTWQPTKVVAASSGDLGYSLGLYEFSMSDPKGKPIKDHGKYLTIWKKQADGAWKAVVDTWNSDVPATPPSN